MSTLKYLIECQSCASTYTSDEVENCKYCGSPLDRKDIELPVIERSTIVYGGPDSPMTIKRRDSFYDYVEYYATKTIGGKKYGAVIQISECMLMDANFNPQEFIERRFRHQIADAMAENMEVVYA